jgi:tRNA (guanine37-N1)-methyltransferase
LRFDIITIFPGLFSTFISESILGKAVEAGLIRIVIRDLREHTEDRHRVTDDYPYGGGAGMVMKPEPIFRAVESVKEEAPASRVVLLSPQGEVFTQKTAAEMAGWEAATLICGRYEGVDQRVVDNLVDREVSIGDYVLTGGEVPAMVLVEAVSRLIPGVVGSRESVTRESFAGGILDHPHYTRPAEYRGIEVPGELLSGHHRQIELWRRREALRRTALRRPDLLKTAPLTEEDRRILKELGIVVNEG